MRIMGLLLGLTLWASSVQAGRIELSPLVFLDGNKLLRLCEEKHLRDEGACYGAALALHDALYSEGHVCSPDGLAPAQARDVLVNALKAHPEDRHYTAYSLAKRAFQEAWPCP